ncbi:hypothetical protein COCNU_02G007340 [Cocos nucifera]|uniref:Uncharacterized protein n=1 Tax=Cocos nucifera TaxID=13894 RepID=A0A8K0HYR8_COCNU|nr:hypothetical protein COCNU_02G007340 [Cocos nucifera]
MIVSRPGPRWRLQRSQALRNWAVPANSKSLKLRLWTLLGSACLRRSWPRCAPSSSDASAAAASSAVENSVTLVVRRIGGRGRDRDRRFPTIICSPRRPFSLPSSRWLRRARRNEGRTG